MSNIVHEFLDTLRTIARQRLPVYVTSSEDFLGTKNRRKHFLDNKYSRAHTWTFDGGLAVPASSSPHVVPVPYSDAAALDPEEAFYRRSFELPHAVVPGGGA